MGCINSTNKTIYTLKRDDIFNVSVVRVQSDQPTVLAKHGFLEITQIELTYVSPPQAPVSWSLQHLRRYGLTGNIFSFEAGRRCPTGPGIYTFRCCNADQFYAKFQRCINSISAVTERGNNSIHPSHMFGRLESQLTHTNQYLEPTSVHVNAAVNDTIMPDSFISTSNEYNPNSPDSLQSSSLTAEIVNFSRSAPSYSNVRPNHLSNSNIYMEQPIRINSEHNNNISEYEINGLANRSQHKTLLKPILKSSSLDIPPEEYAPILNSKSAEVQRIYENVDSSVAHSTSTMNSFNKSSDRFYANIEFLPKLDMHISQSKSLQLDFASEQQQPLPSTNGPIVNYIILDLDQPRSPSQCSPKNGFGSNQSLSKSHDVCHFKKDLSPISTNITSGSSTMPKGSTISDDPSKLPNKLESSGSYTRIDFLKTFALMKSSANCTDFDIENDHEESRITRHSKFVRKAYSISE